MRPAVLLGSVFLPATVWDPLAAELERHAFVVTVARPPVSADPDAVLEAYAEAIGEARDRPDAVVVAHSNAGAYVPALAARGIVPAAVLLDAILPAGGSMRVVPKAFARELSARADDGLLPPWTEWWPREDVRALFPDEAAYAAVRAATPRLPAAYLSRRVDGPASWPPAVPGAFLSFGDAYADDRARALARGWPTARLELGHLGMLEDPRAVARELVALVARLDGTRAEPGGSPGTVPA